MNEERVSQVVTALDHALACLTDEFNAGQSGPSGLRAQAIAQVRQARILLRPVWREIRPGVYVPERPA